jgi:hypothetical protein
MRLLTGCRLKACALLGLTTAYPYLGAWRLYSVKATSLHRPRYLLIPTLVTGCVLCSLEACEVGVSRASGHRTRGYAIPLPRVVILEPETGTSFA